MLRQRRTFRPVLGAALEDRTVPSPFGFGGFFGGFGGFFGRGIASVPAQDARQVAQEFGTFQQTYSQDVRSVLLPAGTTNPATNRTAFNTAVATALGTLNSSIDATIANLPAASSLATTIQGELLGSGTNTLQTLLGAIPTPSNIGFRSFRALQPRKLAVHQPDRRHRDQPGPDRLGADGEHQPDDDPAGSQPGPDRLPELQPDLLQRRADDPAARGDDHPLEPIAPAFDQAVGTALGTLNTNIDSALSNLPSTLTATLDTTIQNDLLTGSSTSGSSLQARLAALPSPSSTTGLRGRASSSSRRP